MLVKTVRFIAFVSSPTTKHSKFLFLQLLNALKRVEKMKVYKVEWLNLLKVLTLKLGFGPIFVKNEQEFCCVQIVYPLNQTFYYDRDCSAIYGQNL